MPVKNRFAELLDRLAYEPGRNNKIRLLVGYFRETEDPDRGYALAALTGALSFKHAKPGLIRDLITERTDPGHHRLNVSSGYLVITKDDLATDKPCLRQPTEVQDYLEETAYLRIFQKAFADPVWQQIQQSAQVVGDD